MRICLPIVALFATWTAVAAPAREKIRNAFDREFKETVNRKPETRGCRDFAAFVDPFIGTTAKCHCTPAAARPFGMVMPGPDTRINSWDATSGYDFADSTLLGFSQTHISGTGCPDLGDVLIHPVSGTLVDGDYRSAFRHADERAEPGYYAVELPGFRVKGEITCTERVSFYRFTYRSDDAHHLMVDTQHGIAFPGNLSKHVVSASADFPDAWTMTGSAHLKNWVERELHWVMRFDRPVVARKETPHPCWGGVGKRYFLTFDIPAGEALQVKVALSMTGVDGARRNLEAELPHWDFARVRDEARKSWNDLLGRIEIDGVDEKAKRIFYTAFYHALLHPDDIADVDGRYRGADGKVAVSPNGHYYSTLSLWDSFRAQQPLIAEFVPERVDGIVQTLLLHWQAAGFLPIWGLAGRDNQCMVGSHAVPVIVDAYLRGFRGFDAGLAYEAVRDTLRNAHPTRRKERWDLLDRYGYYPYDEIRGESVSRTLECAYDDACAARFAEALGKTEDAAFFRRRAANWTNVIDRTIGFARGKDKAGRWREPFDPLTCGQGAEHPNDFTEGNAWQYTWHVMHDPQGLVSWLGGKEDFERKLDCLFVEPPVMKGFGTMEYLENAIGQYAHGNEQVHHVPWLYACIGRRDKASACVRRICETCYSDTPAGYCGNEDCGQLGAWYVFAALGRYPVDPCGGAYVESEPLAPVVRVGGAPGIPTSDANRVARFDCK